MARETDDASRLRSLDPSAVGELHDEIFPQLYRYAHFRLGDATLAEDAASETFVRLLEALHAGRGPRTSARGWLFGTLRHVVDDHYRARYGNPVAPLHADLPNQNGSPDEAVETDEHRRRIQAAVATLTPDQQHVLALRFGGEYSVEETARLMGRKGNAVKALQFRALSALRRALESEAP